MNRFSSLFLAGLLGLVSTSLLHAQKPRKSPHETINNQRLEANLVTIVYGRPYTNDPNTGKPRKIWGDLVPHGKIWRLGADEATLLITQKPLRIGDTSVPAGAYTLFFLLGDDNEGTLIINREIGQWGIDPYHADRELARVKLTREPVATPVHQFTIAFDKTPAGTGVIRLMWEETQYTVPYRVTR